MVHLTLEIRKPMECQRKAEACNATMWSQVEKIIHNWTDLVAHATKSLVLITVLIQLDETHDFVIGLVFCEKIADS